MRCELSTMMYLLLDLDSMLLQPLVRFKLEARQQEKLYWNVVRFLNWLEEMEVGGINHEKTDISIEYNYGIFWDECRSIDESRSIDKSGSIDKIDKSGPSQLALRDMEGGHGNGDADREIQWLSEVGFTGIARKIKAKNLIDQNDDDMKVIAASLTRAQANAVRRRIDSLNEQMRRRQLEDEQQKPQLGASRKLADVRYVFPVQTQGQPTHATSTLVDMFERHAAPPYDGSSPTTRTTGMLKHHQPGPRYPHAQPVDASKLRHQQKAVKVSSLKRQSSIEKSEANKIYLHFESGKEHGAGKENSAGDLGVVTLEHHQLPAMISEVTSGLTKFSRAAVAQFSDSNSVQPKQITSSHYMKLDSLERNSAADSGIQSGLTNRSDQSTFFLLSMRSSCQRDSDTRIGRATGSAVISGAASKASSQNVDFEKLSKDGALRDSFSDHGRPPSEGASLFSSGKFKECDKVSAAEIRSHMLFSDKISQPLSLNEADRARRTSVFTGSGTQFAESSNCQVQVYGNPSHKAGINGSASLAQNTQVMSYHPPPSPVSNHSQHDLPSDRDRSMQDEVASAQRRHPSMSKSLRYPQAVEQSIFSAETSSLPQPRKLSAPTEYYYEGSPHAPGGQAALLPADVKPSTAYPDGVFSDRTSLSGSDDSESLSSYGSHGSSDDLQRSSRVLTRMPRADLGPFANEDGPMTRSQSCNNMLVASPKTSRHSRSLSSEMLPRSSSPELVLQRDAKAKIDGFHDGGSVAAPSFPPLPNFTLMHEDLGITRIGYLSEADMTKVRSLALIELTALFDYYRIPMNRGKAPPGKRKFKEIGVFGVPLTTLAIRESSKKTNVTSAPRILKEMLGYLVRKGIHEEGILRIPGSAPRIKIIREQIEDRFDAGLFQFVDQKPSDVSTILKQFIRELPVPLLSSEYQNTFTAVASFPDRKVQLQALNLLVLLLDPVHQASLQVLLEFLGEVVEQESLNKMGLNNVAMIMAPNLFFENNKKYSIDTNEAQKAAGMTDVLRMLIKYQLILWTIPSFMVSQIRYLYEAGAKTTDPKAVRKIMQKRHVKKEQIPVRGRSSGSSGDELDGVQEQIIQIKAPILNKQNVAIRISDHTTAADVIAELNWRWQNSRKQIDLHKVPWTSKSDKMEKNKEAVQFVLCESGGNIGERRLSDSAIVCSVLKVNAKAEWLLKEESAS